MRKILMILAAVFAAASCSQGERTVKNCHNHVLVSQKGAPTLGYSPESGVTILDVDGLPFKDLDKDGELDIYEDWRRQAEERAADLASQLTVREIAGLMIYSSHQPVTDSLLTGDQVRFLTEDGVRHVLVTKISDNVAGAVWNNRMQALVESLGKGIPANNSSDPRHGPEADGEYTAGNGGHISMWPGQLGLAATFDPEVVRSFGETAGAEYRALGLATTLAPQVDLATDPRWYRFNGTFGEDPQLNIDLTKAYISGFQETKGTRTGWGNASVNCMVKHWPGAGTGEGGRESHHFMGKWAVYPGDGFDLHLTPFTEGAFKLDTKTGAASAVMPAYNISYGQDPSGENRGQNFSHWIIGELLRGRYRYEGVSCTDWNVVFNTAHTPYWYDCREQDPEEFHGGKSWGAEDMTEYERHYRIFRVGSDQIGGGRNDIAPILWAYDRWAEEYGAESARERFELSARRLLMNIFRTGLFENPYLDPDVTEAVVGCPEFVTAGFEAQKKSVVMLKNAGSVLPVKERVKVYMPKRHYPAAKKFFEGYKKESWSYPIKMNILEKYYYFVDNPAEADFAIVSIRGPEALFGHSMDDMTSGGNGYIPITLQYEDYTAEYARQESIAGDCAYAGKTVSTYNRDDMLLVRETKEKMGDKPVVVILRLRNPCVISEIEPWADAILLNFAVSNQAVLEIINGTTEPSGLLPMQMPADMKTVELQKEDIPHDMDCYVDSEGHVYDFAFGLDWSGVIDDERVRKYAKR